MLVAPTAVSALRDHKGLVVRHVVQDGACGLVADERAARNTQRQALAVLAGGAVALAVHAVAGNIFPFIAEVHQCGHVVVHDDNDIAAAPAVAAIRAAGRHKFFSVERHGPIAAPAGDNSDRGFVNKGSRHYSTSCFRS